MDVANGVVNYIRLIEAVEVDFCDLERSAICVHWRRIRLVQGCLISRANITFFDAFFSHVNPIIDFLFALGMLIVSYLISGLTHTSRNVFALCFHACLHR